MEVSSRGICQLQSEVDANCFRALNWSRNSSLSELLTNRSPQEPHLENCHYLVPLSLAIGGVGLSAQFSWKINLNVQQTFNERNHSVNVFDKSNLKVGKNLQVNRFNIISNKIDYQWLNMSLDTLKIWWKNLFKNDNCSLNKWKSSCNHYFVLMNPISTM